ncbi:MAG: hypothetical protein IT181_03745 [Acidobacteria bacterium]|nr:hypothetical protein [Acidobacteriota bacterium]
MDLHRALSALVAAGYLVTAFLEGGVRAAGLLAVPLALVVCLIWYAEAAAEFTGNLGLTPIRRSSPAGLVRGLAWMFLLVPLAGWLASRVRPPS